MHIIIGWDFANSLLHLVGIRRKWSKGPRKHRLPYSDLKSARGKNLRLLIRVAISSHGQSSPPKKSARFSNRQRFKWERMGKPLSFVYKHNEIYYLPKRYQRTQCLAGINPTGHCFSKQRAPLCYQSRALSECPLPIGGQLTGCTKARKWLCFPKAH